MEYILFFLGVLLTQMAFFIKLDKEPFLIGLYSGATAFGVIILIINIFIFNNGASPEAFAIAIGGVILFIVGMIAWVMYLLGDCKHKPLLTLAIVMNILYIFCSGHSVFC